MDASGIEKLRSADQIEMLVQVAETLDKKTLKMLSHEDIVVAIMWALEVDLEEAVSAVTPKEAEVISKIFKNRTPMAKVLAESLEVALE